jgi:ribosomal protein S18 acetylase RimI-like enzyme
MQNPARFQDAARATSDKAHAGRTRVPYLPVMSDFTIRTMTDADLPAVGQLAGRLVRLHHDFDPKRFMELSNPEVGYARYFSSEMKKKEAVLLVAEKAAAVIGYAYGRLEPRSYNELRDACGALHDVYVDEGARAHGAGEALVREIIDRLGKLGAPRILLLTAVQNESAQRLFKKLGFRTTMLEMTREM